LRVNVQGAGNPVWGLEFMVHGSGCGVYGVWTVFVSGFRVKGVGVPRVGSRVYGSRFGVWGLWSVNCVEFRVQGLKVCTWRKASGVWGVGFRVQGSGFRVQGSGFRVQGAGFRVYGVGSKVQHLGLKVKDAPGEGRAVIVREGELVRVDCIAIHLS